ncbi:alpha/beta hydrolase [Lentibacillus saliphilus]|uniref:alpha/beta hydrolase n=1 Tax=Lentibacillus saliphilus TaxID=2737028 RepID=UPI001C2FD1FA
MARRGLMQEKHIDSVYLNEQMTLKIYQPETFSQLYKYHLCIMQDGDDYFQLGRIATLSDQLHADYSITNTIFIGIHYKDRYDRLKKYHPNGEQHEAYIKFLVHEVVPLLDESLPTYHMGQSRALMGDSLGGTMALMAALKYPHTFGKIIMQSPLVNDTVIEAVNTAKNLHSIDIYHSIGTEETNVSTTKDGHMDFLTPNQKLSELLKAKNASYIYKEQTGADHTWTYWQKQLPEILTNMFD